MLNGQVYYHGIIRKSIVAFGRLFSDIYIDRKQGDSVTGTTAQRLQIPLAYAPKEKWLVRLDSDPNLQNLPKDQTFTLWPIDENEIQNIVDIFGGDKGVLRKCVCDSRIVLTAARRVEVQKLAASGHSIVNEIITNNGKFCI